MLVIDADETLEIPTRFKMPRLTADSYDIEVRCGTLTYARKQLLRNSLPWRYDDGILHEHPRCDQARSEEFPPVLGSYRTATVLDPGIRRAAFATPRRLRKPFATSRTTPDTCFISHRRICF